MSIQGKFFVGQSNKANFEEAYECAVEAARRELPKPLDKDVELRVKLESVESFQNEELDSLCLEVSIQAQYE